MYLKDGPLRRSSECIAMHSKCISKTVPQEGVQNALLCIQNVSKRWSFKKEFRMHCNAFIMLYLKDGILRRGLECIGLHNVVPKRRSIKEISNTKGEKEWGMRGRGRRGGRGRGWEFQCFLMFSFVCK